MADSRYLSLGITFWFEELWGCGESGRARVVVGSVGQSTLWL